MALPVLDGNQSATTLSSVVTGGEHIVAHTVVSLGSTAILNISSAISGVNNSIGLDGASPANNNFIKIGGHQDGQNQTEHIVHVSAGGAMKVDASDSSVTFGLASVTFSAVSISNFPSTQTIAGTVTVGSSSVTFNSNVAKRDDGSWTNLGVETGSGYVKARVYPSDVSPFTATVTVGNSVTVAGTVTANLGSQAIGPIVEADTPYSPTVRYMAVVGGLETGSGSYKELELTSTGGVKVGSLPTLTPQLPRVTFIDGSGSVTTANTAITVFASSTTRSYLLVQVTTGSAFVNVGATATTLNGISLTAGQGYAWETTIPQGVVSLISTTTNSAYVAKQA